MSLISKEYDSFFASVMVTLRPYLDEIVCMGGCANALYRFHERASDVTWAFLGTMDIDAAVPHNLPLNSRPPVAQLMKDVGFKELICGNADDAVIKYGPFDEEGAVDLEFLCDLSGLSKDNQARAAIPVQDGLYAQPLRYLAMSLNNTWRVELGGIPGFEKLKGIAVQVPNPAAYVASKVLIRGEKRKQASMDKDSFYIYEVSTIFRDAFDVIREAYERLEPCAKKWKPRFAKDARALFESEYAEGPVGAVGIYRDLGDLRGQDFEVTEEIVCRSVNRLLDALLS
jgi:hypothetical protein